MALGFISREKIPYAQLLGDGSMIFYPAKDDPVSINRNNFRNYFLSFEYHWKYDWGNSMYRNSKSLLNPKINIKFWRTEWIKVRGQKVK